MQNKAYFITFEGGDGVGKSTQLTTIRKLAHSFIHCTTPSEVEEAQLIRSLLLTLNNQWEVNTEIVLHLAARLEHVKKLIKPKLKSGVSVICDRFFDSTLVYQGYARGGNLELIKALQQQIVGDITPDLTFIFDLNPEISLTRAKQRSKQTDRYESQSLEFHQKVRQGFLEVAKSNPLRSVIIDATMPAHDISELIAKTIKTKLGLII